MDERYMLCIGCGKRKVWGKHAEEVKMSFINSSMSEEEATAYILNYADLYFDCPDGGHEKFEIIPYSNLEDGAYYTGHCRNASVARWDANKNKFTYLREKFGSTYPEDINYWTEPKPGEHKWDEFKPYCKIDEPSFKI